MERLRRLQDEGNEVCSTETSNLYRPPSADYPADSAARTQSDGDPIRAAARKGASYETVKIVRCSPVPVVSDRRIAITGPLAGRA